MAAAAQHAVVSPTSSSTTTKRLIRACMPPAAAAGSSAMATLRLTNVSQQQKPVVAFTAVTAPAAGAGTRYDATPTPTQTLACMWQEVQGANDWRGLVEPLHPLLLAEVVRYARLVAASYRAFELDPTSKRYLNCKHGRGRVLPAVGMADAGYAVTKYVYAAPDLALIPMGIFSSRRHCGSSRKKSRWIGYVAVASDAEAGRLGRRDILVSFRGTVTCSEWLANFMSALSPVQFDPTDLRPNVRVESGFLSLYTSDNDATGSCRNQLLSEISRLIAEYKHEDLSITLAGHSMGSSLAILLGYDLAELGLNRRDVVQGGAAIPITIFSFGGPRVGNLEFKRRCHELGVKVLRVVNVKDPVTKMPGVLFNADDVMRYEMPWSKVCYAHVGVEIVLDFFKAGDLACVHDLQEAYINQLVKCRKDVDIASTVRTKDIEAVRDRVTSMLEPWSWRWQMVVIRAGELLRAIGI